MPNKVGRYLWMLPNFRFYTRGFEFLQYPYFIHSKHFKECKKKRTHERGVNPRSFILKNSWRAPKFAKMWIFKINFSLFLMINLLDFEVMCIFFTHKNQFASHTTQFTCKKEHVKTSHKKIRGLGIKITPRPKALCTSCNKMVSARAVSLMVEIEADCRIYVLIIRSNNQFQNNESWIFWQKTITNKQTKLLKLLLYW